MTNEHINKLAKFINSHDNCMFIAADGDNLKVASLVVKDGKASMVQESIEATAQSVRDWLGY